ncbi:MAG: OmpA family protein [Cytophagales bacterium]|nr:OmpA family protein [Cytophagales bacterium]
MKHIKLVFLILFLCWGFFDGMAQGVPDTNKQQALELISSAEEILKSTSILIFAREQFEQAALLDPENAKANYKTGELYLETSNKGNALPFLLKTQELDPDYTFHLAYQIGSAYHYAFQFEEGIQYYNLYLKKLEQNPKYRGKNKVPKEEVQQKIEQCKNGIKFKKHQGNYKIVKVSDVLNSLWSDYAPTLNADENILVFTSRRDEDNLSPDVDLSDGFYFEEIFISRKEGGAWSSPENIGEAINTKAHDSNLSLSADGKTLYIYKSDKGSGDIYYSERQADNKWSEPKSIDKSGKINTRYSENSMTISPDGNTLIFSSDRPNSIGGLDLFITHKDKKGDWKRPTNLGDVINTRYDDDSPFLDFDGKTLYFSSRGHDGMGGFDMYRSEYDSLTNEWSKPINLGLPVNTPDNDSYFVTSKDGKRGYFSSARENGLGYEDLYMIYLPGKEEILEINRRVEQEEDYVIVQNPLNTEEMLGDVKAAANTSAKRVIKASMAEPDKNKAARTKSSKNEFSTKKPVSVIPAEKPAKPAVNYKSFELTVRLLDFQTDGALDGYLNIRDLKSKKTFTPERLEKGKYRIKFSPNRSYTLRVEVSKDGYTFNSVKIPVRPSTKENRKISKTLFIEPLRVGATKILRNVYFKFGSNTLDKSSYPELNTLYNLLKSNMKIVAEIAGHSDNIGSRKLNQQVSEQRARAIVRYLVRKGINPKRLRAIGYGETRPLASNDDEKEGRELNRRVEVKILGL